MAVNKLKMPWAQRIPEWELRLAIGGFGLWQRHAPGIRIEERCYK